MVALLVLLASVVTILIALAFEHFGGYRPCQLCGWQRYAYYFAIPATLAALSPVGARWRRLPGLLLRCVTIAFAANALLALYHSGVEWHWWAGPTSCGGTTVELSTSAGGMLESLENSRVIRCDEAPWRLAGLSFAGWNIIVSAALGVLALKASLQPLRSAGHAKFLKSSRDLHR